MRALFSGFRKVSVSPPDREDSLLDPVSRQRLLGRQQ